MNTASLMSPEEVAQAQIIAQESDNPIQIRIARTLLAYQVGKPTREAAVEAGLSRSRARYWRRAFKQVRMGVFDHHRVAKAQVRGGQPEAAAPSEDVLPQIVVSFPQEDEPLLPAPDPTLESVLFTQPVEAVAAENLASSFPQRRNSPGLQREDSMAEAGRKILSHQFAEMLAHEEGTRLGEDIEDLHDMRVATRRMRAAFDLFVSYYQPKISQSLLKGLRKTGRTLGAVRDMDVFIENARAYAASLPEGDRQGVDPLVNNWLELREKHRSEMLVYLDSPGYARFKERFNLFVQTAGMGTLPPEENNPLQQLVQNVVPQIIYNRFANVRAYETILTSASLDQLHALRIESKKLRYAVEFFREVLGPEAKAVINGIKKLQDHLGALNDARVACELLSNFLEEWEIKQASLPLAERVSSQPLVTYLAASYAERHRLMISFPEVWQEFSRPEFRQNLAAAIGVL